MFERLRFPRLQIATKMYGAIALILAAVYVLAAATPQFAGRTEEAARRLPSVEYSAVQQYGMLEVALEHQRRLVATAAFLSDERNQQEAERASESLTAQVSELL